MGLSIFVLVNNPLVIKYKNKTRAVTKMKFKTKLKICFYVLIIAFVGSLFLKMIRFVANLTDNLTDKDQSKNAKQTEVVEQQKQDSLSDNKEAEDKKEPEAQTTSGVDNTDNFVVSEDENVVITFTPDDAEKTPTNKIEKTETTVRNILSLTDKYKNDYINNGSTIIFNCVSSKFVYDKSKNRYLICLDPNNYSDYIAVNAYPLDPSKIAYGDRIKIEGFVDSTLFGMNAFGVESEVVIVWPIFLSDLTSGYEF